MSQRTLPRGVGQYRIEFFAYLDPPFGFNLSEACHELECSISQVFPCKAAIWEFEHLSIGCTVFFQQGAHHFIVFVKPVAPLFLFRPKRTKRSVHTCCVLKLLYLLLDAGAIHMAARGSRQATSCESIQPTQTTTAPVPPLVLLSSCLHCTVFLSLLRRACSIQVVKLQPSSCWPYGTQQYKLHFRRFPCSSREADIDSLRRLSATAFWERARVSAFFNLETSGLGTVLLDP